MLHTVAQFAVAASTRERRWKYRKLQMRLLEYRNSLKTATLTLLKFDICNVVLRMVVYT